MNANSIVSDDFPDPLAGRHAGFWLRCIAAHIDIMLIIPVYWGLRAMLGYDQIFLAQCLFTVIAILFYAFFFSSKWHATPGLKLLGVHIVDRQGQAVTFAQSLKWGIVSAVCVGICFGGFLYMQYRFDLYGVLQLLQSCYEENVMMEDCLVEINNIIDVPFDTFQIMLQGSSLLTAFMVLIWTLSVALTQDKSGFHNLISNTRFIKGRA